MSDSVRPHRQQPTRLLHPWDSPGKNTGVGCHFLLQCMKVKSDSEVSQSCPTLSDPIDCSPSGSAIHGIFLARVLGCHCLFRCVPNETSWEMILVHIAHKGQLDNNCKCILFAVILPRLFFLLFFFGVQLLYTAVSVSSAHQSESVICIKYILSFLDFLPT